MRVEQAQQGIGQLGELVVEPVMHTRRQERDPFEQARDMGVVHRIGREAQAASDLWVGVGELGRQALDRVEFAFVIGEEGVRHQWDRMGRGGTVL